MKTIEDYSPPDHLKGEGKNHVCWSRPLVGLQPCLRLGNAPMAVPKTFYLGVTIKMPLTL